MLTKHDVVNRALSIIGISSSIAAPPLEFQQLAVVQLDAMVASWENIDIYLNYRFSYDPDLNQRHGLDKQYFDLVSYNLALRLAPQFSVMVDPAIEHKASSAISSMLTTQAIEQQREVQHSGRMTIGIHNARRASHIDSFYDNSNDGVQARDFPKYTIYRGDQEIITEDFTSDLLEGQESLASATVDVDQGLTLKATRVLDTQVQFVIASDRDDSFDERKAVMIEIESNTGRRIVRVLYITARATDDYDYIQSDVTLNDAETLPDIPINPAGRPFTPNEVSGPDWQLTNSGIDQQPADDETISDSPINPFNVYTEPTGTFDTRKFLPRNPADVPHTPISRILAIEGFQRNTLFGVSPFFSNSSIDAYYAQNSDSLFNSETDTTLAVYAGAIQYGSGELSALTTDVLTNNGLYLLQWNGVNMPGSYNPANWGVLSAFDTEAFDDLYSDDVPELSSRANVSTAYDTGQPAYTREYTVVDNMHFTVDGELVDNAIHYDSDNDMLYIRTGDNHIFRAANDGRYVSDIYSNKKLGAQVVIVENGDRAIFVLSSDARPYLGNSRGNEESVMAVTPRLLEGFWE